MMDARSLARHDTGQYRTVRNGAFGDVTSKAIDAMFRLGVYPDPRGFHDEKVLSLVAGAYGGDLALHRSRFPGTSLFDD